MFDIEKDRMLEGARPVEYVATRPINAVDTVLSNLLGGERLGIRGLSLGCSRVPATAAIALRPNPPREPFSVLICLIWLGVRH
jgi:hypothetical protein